MRKFSIAIILLALAFASPAKADWWQAETAHFVVKSRASEKDAREYALEMEKFDAALRVMFGLPIDTVESSRANKPTIYRYGRTYDIARLAGYPGSSIAGFFISRAGDSVAFAPAKRNRSKSSKTSVQLRRIRGPEMQPSRILAHEYTHYFMMQHFPAAYPRWYVEGFAEMMSTARYNDDGSVHIGDPPQDRATLIFRIKDFPMDEMLDPNHELTGLDSLKHYATGWLLTHYMSFDPERQVKLRQYLMSVANGEDALASARQEFGDFDQLERALDKYKDGPFPGRRIARVAFNENVELRKLTKEEEATILLEMRIKSGISDEDEAKKIASDLRKITGSQPGNTRAWLLLAEAEIAAKDYAAADDAARALIEIEPDNHEGWLARAIAAAMRVKDDSEMADLAREHATNAANLDPEDPRPLIAYYLSYLRSEEEPTMTAVVALEQAFAKAGSDPGYRLLLARQLLIEDRIDSAQVVLMPIAFSGHRTSEPKDAEKPTLPRLLDLIVNKDRDGALAMVDKMIDDEEEDEG